MIRNCKRNIRIKKSKNKKSRRRKSRRKKRRNKKSRKRKSRWKKNRKRKTLETLYRSAFYVNKIPFVRLHETILLWNFIHRVNI